MKKCPKCLFTKNLHDFYKNKSKASGFASWCKSCTKKASKESYNKNIESNREKGLNNYYDRVNLNKQKLEEYIGGFTCKHCNTIYPYEVFDWHHINPNEKEGSMSKLIRLKDFEVIKKEVDKCILLCANCHRIEHIRLKENK